MRVEVLVAFVFCAAGLVHSLPLGDSSFLDLAEGKTSPGLGAKDASQSEAYDDDRSLESTMRKLRQGSGAPNVFRLDRGRMKRPFGESSSWNSLDVPDPFFNPTHLQNWSSQFGRNYRAFNGGGGHQGSSGGLRPAPGGLYPASVGLFGEDGLQDWRALYHDGRF